MSGGVAIKPEWDRLFPDCEPSWKEQFALYKQLVASLPEPRRAAMKKLKLASGLGAAPEALTVTRVLKPKKRADLSPIEQKQLVAFGKAYDGARGNAQTRFDEYSGDLEIRDVARSGDAAFVVFLYSDAGSIPATGSTKEALQCVLGAVKKTPQKEECRPKPSSSQNCPQKREVTSRPR